MFPVSGILNLASSLGTLSSTLAALVCAVQLTEVSTLVTVSNCELCLWGCNYNEHDFDKILLIQTLLRVIRILRLDSSVSEVWRKRELFLYIGFCDIMQKVDSKSLFNSE